QRGLADRRLEGLGEEALRLRQRADLRAVGRTALAVDRRDLADLQVQALRRLLQAGAAGQLVVELVDDRHQRLDGVAVLQRLLDLGADLVQARVLAGLDVRHPQQVPTEAALDRCRDTRLGEAERGLADGRRQV